MSFLSGGAKSTGYKPNFTGLQIQTSINTLPIPVGWGKFRVAPNVIFTGNFRQYSKSQKVGKGLFGGGSSTTYTYSADIIMGICEGPISGITQIWKDGTIYYSLSAIGLSLALGNTPQSPWPYLYSTYPGEALTYPGTAYVHAANYSLGSSASISNHNFEVETPLAGTGANGVDADPAYVIEDFLTNQQYGVGFPSGSINYNSMISSPAATTTGDAALQTYCKAVGIAFSPVLTNVETAQSVLQRWQKLLNCAVFVSGGQLNMVPFGDTTVSGNGVTYVPNLTPIFNLGDGDFQGDASSDPLQEQITDITEAYNVERININDRAAAYNSIPIEARDEAMVNQFGLRVDTSVSASEICDANVAGIVAQLILQRQLYVRNTATIKLDARYCGLDPMDIVTLTDSALGMGDVAVRILQIEEQDDSGVLTVQVEELPAGVGTAAIYAKQSNSFGGNGSYAEANPVNPPVIFEPPATLTGGVAQVWIGASGSAGGVADPLWAGADVYISLDNTTYSYIGTIEAPARQGVLVAALAAFAGANPDTTDTLSVDMTVSGGTLSNATDAVAAANGATMCYVDGEIISFVSATLTGGEQYALSTLYRGQNGTPANSHAQGAVFCRLDDAVFTYEPPAAYVGQALYVKLASFSTQGTGLQPLSDCVAYPYVPTGSGNFGPVSTALAVGTPLDLGQVTDISAVYDDFGTVYDTVNVPVDLGTVP
jgi:hypothetical protein